MAQAYYSASNMQARLEAAAMQTMAMRFEKEPRGELHALWRAAVTSLPSWLHPQGAAVLVSDTADEAAQDREERTMWEAVLGREPQHDQSTLLLFLHHSSFSWHSGAAVCKLLRFSCWQHAICEAADGFEQGSEPGGSAVTIADAFRHALPASRRSPRSQALCRR